MIAKKTIILILLAASIGSPIYAAERPIGPMGRRARELLSQNPFSQYYQDAHGFSSPSSKQHREPTAPVPALKTNQAIAYSEITDEYIVVNVDRKIMAQNKDSFDFEPVEVIETSPDVVTEEIVPLHEKIAAAEPEPRNVPVKKIETMPVYTEVRTANLNLLNPQPTAADEQAYIYDSSSISDYEYTPEQLEQIKAAQQTASNHLNNFRQSGVIHHEQIQVQPKFCSTTTSAPANDYSLETKSSGESLRKSRKSKKEDLSINEEKAAIASELKESQKLREQLKDLMNLSDRKNYQGQTETFAVREDKSLNETVLNFPENTLYIDFNQQKTVNVIVSIDKVTDIRLKEYEKVTDITVGTQDGLSIEGYKDKEDKHSHITIKPYDNGIDTTLRVTTNYSHYQFILKSGKPEEYNPYVLFKLGDNQHILSDTLGDRESAKLRKTRQAKNPIEVAEPDELNFNYTVKGKKYVPKHIFDDGRFTYVLLPKVAYEKGIYILGILDDKVQQIREYELQDEFMKIYGTWTKIRFRIEEHQLELINNEYIPN